MVVEHAPEPMVVEHATEGRTLRKRKEKGPKHLKRGATEKEMDNFTKKVLMIPLDKPFDEAYFTHRLWMFFREPKETEKDIEGMFHQVRENMRQRITLKKKSDPGKFVVPCLIGGIDYTSVFCDTDSSFSILPKVMADHIGLEIMHSKDSFTFVDCSKRNSGGIIKNFEVQIGNAIVLVYFHVLDQAQLKFFSATWESFHGYYRSSLQHADQQILPDTHRL